MKHHTMIEICYQVGTQAYGGLLRLLSPAIPKARLFVAGRKDWRARLKADWNPQGAPVAWFHCASLGEFEQGRPVIEAFREAFPAYRILLTFFSPSGYEVRKQYAGADYVCYLPLDTERNAEDFVALVRPSVAFFVKYEFWHFYTRALQRAGVPMVSFSAIFRPSQAFFKSYGGFYRDILARFAHIFVQNEASAQLLKGIGLQQVSVGGDTRFDRVAQVYAGRKEIPLAAAFKGETFTVVMGSSWQHDLQVTAQSLSEFPHPIKVIVAPHEIEEGKLRQVEEAFEGRKVLRYSQATPQTAAQADVLLIDNVGMLSSLYRYADVAYVGGAFGKGLHNILEASVYGIPVVFGARYQKFQEAVELVAERGAFSVPNAITFGKLLLRLYTDEPFRRHAGDVAFLYTQSRKGATAQVVDYCRGLLK